MADKTLDAAERAADRRRGSGRGGSSPRMMIAAAFCSHARAGVSVWQTPSAGTNRHCLALRRDCEGIHSVALPTPVNCGRQTRAGLPLPPEQVGS